MSCSTTSLLAGTITTNTLSIEDPYIFTETVPTTPPLLFSNSQKSRNRFEAKPQQQNIITANSVITSKATTTQTTNKESSYVKLKNYGTQTQTSSALSISTPLSKIVTTTTATTSPNLQQQPPTAVLGVINTNNIKYEAKSSKLQEPQQQRQTKHAQHIFTTSQNENIIAKQQKQQLQQQQQQTQKTQTLSTTPPPLLLSHTPSLWQTPLLLENSTTGPTAANATTTTTTTSVANSLSNQAKETTVKLGFKTPQPPSQSPQPPTPTLAATALITPTVALPIISNASSSVTATTNITNSVAITGNTTAMHMLMPSAAPLPPSNFHHTTLAQHLQKLQCLKKPKKPNILIAATAPAQPLNDQTTSSQILAIKDSPSSLSSSTTNTTIPTLLQKSQHSSNDLNEIPVNVIFRSPKSTDSKKEACNSTESNIQIIEPITKQTTSKQQQLINASTSVSNCSKINQIQKRINNNDQQQQCFENYALKKKQRKIKKSNQLLNVGPKLATSTTKTETKTSNIVLNNLTNYSTFVAKTTKNIANAKKRFNISNRYRKTNVFPTLLNEVRDRAGLSLIPDISLSTKAVAVVKRPYKIQNTDFKFHAAAGNEDDDDTNENDLPFCVQKCWFTTHQDPTLSSALGREGRIAEYKSVLRRQAIQLLATRSLQRLPFHVARKRLLCVDALLRKYRDQNKTVSNGSARKQCEFEMCKNAALTMTTFCQQHIIKNSKQNLFVLCSAKKKLKENCLQQNSCDIPVLNIQKQYTPPLCYVHLGKQQTKNTFNNGNPNCNSQINGAKQWNNGNNNKNFNTTKSIIAATTTTTSRKRKLTTNKINLNNNNNNNKNVLETTNLINMNEDTPKLLNRIDMQRKNSTTSLESIASNSHSSFGSTTLQTGATTTTTAAATNIPILEPLKNNSNSPSNMLSPPALAPLSYHNTNLQTSNQNQRQNQRQHFISSTIDPVAEQEINKLVAQFAMAAAATSSASNKNCSNNNINTNNNNNSNNNNNNNNNNFNSFNFLNTNSNSNLTSSGVGSSSSLPSTADELLTQDMLSNCENSSAYASSSEDTGLGELSESELIAVNSIANNIDTNAIVNSFSNVHGSIEGNCVGGSGFNDDDVIPDEIPLGDERLLEENDLVNVFDTLPVNLNELFSAVVRQDEREEIERALEIADKHLKSLQQTIGSDTDFLADFLNVNDEMLAETDDICNKMEIVSSVLPPNENLEAAALYLENADSVLSGGGVGENECGGDNHHQYNQTASNLTLTPTNCAVNNGTTNASVIDVRGLLQT